MSCKKVWWFTGLLASLLPLAGCGEFLLGYFANDLVNGSGEFRRSFFPPLVGDQFLGDQTFEVNLGGSFHLNLVGGIAGGQGPFKVEIIGPNPSTQVVFTIFELEFDWLPTISGTYTIVVTDDNGQGHSVSWTIKVQVTIIVVGPTPPSPPAPPPTTGSLDLVVTKPADNTAFHIGDQLVLVGTITNGSPPFVLQVDLYDNRRLTRVLGSERSFSISFTLDIPTTGLKANLIQVSSADTPAQIDHQIVKIAVSN